MIMMKNVQFVYHFIEMSGCRKMKCDNCGSKENYVKKYKHLFTKNNNTIEVESERRFCSNCNNLVYDSELDNKAIKKALKIYNDKYGVSEKIKRIRKELGLSQEEFAKIIGCAKKTLISYEKGMSIPNDVYLVSINTIIDNPNTIKLFIDSNIDRYNNIELQKINKKLNKYYTNNSQALFDDKELEASEYNGYTKLSKDKIINLISILSENGINKSKLLKELFYIDFLTYKKYLCSLTGLEYSKLPYGPVPDDFENIIDTLYINEKIKYDKKYKDDYEEHIITNNINTDYSVFRKEELEIINKVKEKFKDYKVKEIEDFSHKEQAYKKTAYTSKISYDYALDLNID